MPTVPTYDQRTVRDAGAPNQFQTGAGATPAAFGALEGQAVQGFGKSLESAATSMDNIANRVAQQDAAAKILQLQTDDANKRRDFYYGENGVFNTTGSNAMGITDKVKKFEGDLFKERLAGITDPVVRQKYGEIYQRTQTSYLDNTARHEATNRKQFQIETGVATANVSGLNAVNAYDKPDLFNEEIGNIRRAIAASNAGSPAEEIDFKTRTAVSGVYKNATLIQLEKDPRAAKAWYDSNKDHIEAGDRLQLERAFEVPMRQQRLVDTRREMEVAAGNPGAALVRALPEVTGGATPAGQTEAGNIDLHSRPVVKNADGSISTVRSMSVNFGKGEVLIPTVADDGSRILSEKEAVEQYKRTGQHLGIFDTPEHATAYAESLHNEQDAEYSGKSNGGALVRSVVGSESSGRTGAVSPVGASGLMQIMPGTAREIDNALGGMYGLGKMTDDQVQEFYKNNPQVSLTHGSYYLQQQLNKYDGDIEAALVAYNAGPANADKFVKARLDGNPDPYSVLPKRSETEPYVKKTLTRYAEELGGPTETTSTLRDMPALPKVGTRITSADQFPPNSYYAPDAVFRGRPGANVDARALTMANELGRRFEELTGKRVEMNSGFRDAGTNARVGGAKQSRHMHGDAFDFNIKDLPDEEKTAFLSLARQVGFSGVGFYENGPGHLHLDIGRARTWGGLPDWAKGATQETASTGYLGQASMAVGFGNLPMPGNMALQASGITQPNAAIAAAGALPVTAPFSPGSLVEAPAWADTTTTTGTVAAPPLPPPVSTRVDPTEFDPDDFRNDAMRRAEADPENGQAILAMAERIIGTKQRAAKSALKEVANEGWAHVIQGGAVDEMPAQVLRALMEKDPEAIKRMQEFEDRRETRRDKTDEATYYALSQLTPQDLAHPDFNLMQFAPKLSAADLKHFAQQQADARKAGRDAGTASGFLSPQEIGNMALAKMGIETTGTNKDPVRAGMFLRRLNQEVVAITTRTGNAPSAEDVQKIADRLSTVVPSSGQSGWKNKFLFEMGTAAENEARRTATDIPGQYGPVGEFTQTFQVASEYKNIPIEGLSLIANGRKAALQDLQAQPEIAKFFSGNVTAKDAPQLFNEIVTASTGRPVPPVSNPAFTTAFRKNLSQALGRPAKDDELSVYYSRFLRKYFPYQEAR